MPGEVLTVGPLPLLTPAGCAGLAGSTSMGAGATGSGGWSAATSA